MEYLIMGIAAAFNFIVIYAKIQTERYADAFLDAFTLTALSYIFAGTLGGMQVATVASALVSIWLFFFPPKFLNFT